MDKAPNDETDTAPIVDAVLPTVINPLEVKSLALVVMASIAIIFALDWAQSFVIIMLIGILLAYTLNPVVKWLEYIRIPRTIGSSIVILALLATIIFFAFTLRDQVESIITRLPEAATKLTSSFVTSRGDPLTNMQKVQIAANQVENATSSPAPADPTLKKPSMHVVIDKPKFQVGDFLWRGSLGLFGSIGQAITTIILAYFLLLSGDTFKRKLVRLTGPTISRKKITVHILEDINHSIQRYMFILLVTNLMVGILSWVVFRLIGLDNAGAWAVASGFMHIVPYFGPVATAAATGMAAFMQFDSLLMALLVAGASLLIATIIGIFVTTWMTGRFARMNPAAVFTSLLFFTWLWGLWGMLLGIPVIVIMKVVCERIERLQPIAELLGE